MVKKIQQSEGYSLVELLVAVVIAGIVSAAIYNVFKSQSDTYHVQDQVVDMQQNLRAAMDIVTRDLRMVGYRIDGVVDPIETGNIDFDNDGTDDLVSNNNGALGGTDALSIKMFTDRPMLVAKHTAAATNLSVCGSSGQQVNSTLLTVDSDATEFQLLKVLNVENLNCITECGGPCDKITFAAGHADFYSLSGLGVAYENGEIAPFSARHYYVLPDSDGDGTADDPALMRRENFGAAEIVAKNIEDMQIVYLDAAGNTTTTPAQIRQVRLTLVARSRNPLTNLGAAESTRPAVEDHAAAGSADGYTRRVLTRLVTPRNLGL